jgi:hypothetical protein
VDEGDDDKDDERSSDDDCDAEPPSSPVRPPKARGKGKAMEKDAIPASKCYYFFCYFWFTDSNPFHSEIYDPVP